MAVMRSQVHEQPELPKMPAWQRILMHLSAEGASLISKEHHANDVRLTDAQ